MATTSRLTVRRPHPALRGSRSRSLPDSLPSPSDDRAVPRAPAAPIVKWAGGKSKLLGELLARRPSRFRRYYEPFLGGGALFFRMAPNRAVLSDWNEDLINVYRCVAWHVEAVIARLRTHRREHDEAHYYQTRQRWNEQRTALSDVARAATFIYLNKTCYNGLYRVNRRGHFNVPMGRYADPTICEAEKLRAASRVLQRSQLHAGHFADQVTGAGPGDFVYFDPPYDPASKTANFTSYTATRFGDDDQHDLARVIGDLTDRGVFVMLSSSDTPYIRHLYRGFKMDSVQVSRAINSRGSSRGPVGELIITNGYLS